MTPQLTIVTAKLDRMRKSAKANKVDPRELVDFLDELENTLLVLGQVAWEAHDKIERLPGRP